MKKCLLILLIASIAFSSCEKEDFASDGMTYEQRSLIGRAVNFSATIMERFTTKASYNNNGNFNDGDFLTVYREYLDESTNTFGNQDFRVYHRYQEYIPGTNYPVGDPSWKPVVGKKGYNSVNDGKHGVGTFTQDKGDSLTWENGKTVRYRAVGRSNYAGSIGGATSNSKSYYYPDYTYCEWVTASGPTNDVAFTMKHLGSRLIFTAKKGNVIKKVELTVDWKDYKYEDNSDKHDSDIAESEITDELAQERASAVAAVYNQMCLPAGVDAETGMLKAMTKSLYSNSTNFYNLDEKTESDGIILYGTKTPEYIASYAQRPVFNQINTQFIMISNPYNLSSENSGQPLVLPDFTRFRVYIYDVNSGDNGSDEYEKAYHILDLRDIASGTDSEGTPIPAFPNGLELIAGDSYHFEVGYYYDNFTVSIENSGLSWSEQTAYSGTADLNSTDIPSDFDYEWWKTGIKKEVPEFTLSSPKDFLEFIKIVNGTATSVSETLKQEYREIKRPNGTVDEANSGYWWYTMDGDEKKWHGKVGTDTPFASGTVPDEFCDNIFYQHWTVRDGTSQKELRWDYLKHSFSFCDESVQTPYTVKLNSDICLNDWDIPSIGSETSPFRGVFDGDGHLVSDIRVSGGYLFGFINSAEIKNLRIRSLHNTSLINNGIGSNYIIGVSIDAPCSGPSIAASLIGTDGIYRNNSYVVGCIHVGQASAAMVGQSDALVMLGCMEAGSGIPSGTPALLGQYAGSLQFFNPQGLTVTLWDDFMCNYYDTQLSPGTLAAPGKGTLAYSYQEYIRGLKTSLLKSTQDYFISDETPYNYLTDAQRLAFYGLAPYKAMNYAIWKYNSSVIGENHACSMKYIVDTTGYDNRYPTLVKGILSDECKQWNVLNQNN